MSDNPFQKVVADDASPEDLLGAITLSELRRQQYEELRETLPPQIIEAVSYMSLRPGQLEAMIAQALQVATEAIDISIEKIKLRLEGKSPLH